MRAALRWLIDDWQWPYAGTLAAVFLLALVPVLWSVGSLALALVLLQLPVYMIHQLEEHADDRFRRYVNATLGRGRTVLERGLTFWVNALCVWALCVLALLLAVFVDLGLGLIAVYLTAFNAFTHVAAALASRAYNPGLWTALALFVPASAAGTYELVVAADPGVGIQLAAIGTAVGLHVALFALIFRSAARARAAAPG